VAGVAVVLIVACAGIGYFALRNANTAADAKQGDCLAGDSISSSGTANKVKLEVVDCGDGKAKYKVSGRVEDVPQSLTTSQTTTVCNAFPDATNVVWVGKDVNKGTALCVVEVKK
jgi:hypothetical protein